MARVFPEGFLWGAATSSHQVEGNNALNDWWEWEARGNGAEKSGAACDSYNRYEEDFDIASELKQNAHRLSIEWSRVEPRKGEWDEREIEHYKNVIAALKKRNILPAVTLHHFTNPMWLAREGGWESSRITEYFERYALKVFEALGRDVELWITINEPLVFIYQGYVAEYWPPGKSSIKAAVCVFKNMARAHSRAYDALHGRAAAMGFRPKIGIAHAMQDFEPRNAGSFRDRLAVRTRDFFNNRLFLKLVRAKLDFVGLNYYFREIIGSVSWKGWASLAGEVCRKDDRYLASEKSDLEWEVYPRGIRHVLVKLKAYNLPIYVTENGICTSDESLRERFIGGHLTEVHEAIRDGADVRGYFYWSLLDNFEWSFGFKPRFGIVHVDYATQMRKVKDSALYYARICENNSLNEIQNS